MLKADSLERLRRCRRPVHLCEVERRPPYIMGTQRARARARAGLSNAFLPRSGG